MYALRLEVSVYAAANVQLHVNKRLPRHENHQRNATIQGHLYQCPLFGQFDHYVDGNSIEGWTTINDITTFAENLVAGDDGLLLVATFEEGENPEEIMFDIFDEEGVFIARKSLNIYAWEGHLWARIRADKLYCLEEKATSYKELVVYKMKWE